MTGFALFLYRWAWRLLLPPVLVLDACDRLSRARTGRGFLPGNRHVTQRAGLDGAASARTAVPEGRGAAAGKPALWLHCASLGEAKGMWAVARSLAADEAFRSGGPGDHAVDGGDILLTATTASGAGFLERQCEALRSEGAEGADRLHARIAPFDHPALVGRFLERHRVRGLCLYEAELWPHYMAGCRERGLPVALLSGRMTEKAEKWYRRLGGARLLDGLAWIQAQTEADADRFRSLGKAEVCLGSDLKAVHYLRHRSGGAHPLVREAEDARPDSDTAAPTRFAFISLHFAELMLLRKGLPDLMARFDVTVFPRHMGELPRFRAVLGPLGFAPHSRDPRARHLLVDSMGLVEPLLRECRSAFVGGSLIPQGCHNLWEPLLAGLQIHFGPRFEGQGALAGLLLERGIAAVLRDPASIGECPPPGPEIPAVCEALAEELRQGAESALADGVERIFVTFYPEAGVRTAAAI